MIPLPSPPKIVEKKGNKAIFEIEGLYPGYGVTIGNSLRRVLLSSLEGVAITRVKIKGVQHEFSTIPGVLEDVLHIILNLKQIRCRMYGEEPQKLELTVKGEKGVRAGDFKIPTQVEIVNKDAKVATLTAKNASLDMEVFIERGLGYVPAEQRKKEKLEIGTLMLDAIFSPVRRVVFRVENMRVGERTDFDRLFLEIETDGTVAPEDALARASEILLNQFQHINSHLRVTEKPAPKKTAEKTVRGAVKLSSTTLPSEEDINKKPIEELKLSTRTRNALLDNNIKTVGGLMRKSEASLAELDGLGDKGLQEVKRKLKKLGLELK